MGPEEPKRFAIVFDRDLGGRMHDVCEKYYAAAVDTQVDLGSVRSGYDSYLAMKRMPLRLSQVGPAKMLFAPRWNTS